MHIVRGLVKAGVVLMLVCVAFQLLGCAPKYLEPEADVNQGAVQAQNEGDMSADEFRRVSNLGAVAQSGHSLSESDIDWLISLANRPGTPHQQMTRLTFVSLSMSCCNKSTVPTDRIGAVFNFAKELAAMSTTNGGQTGMFACLIMKQVVGAPAIPDLKALALSPNQYVRNMARHCLRKIANGT